MSIINTLPEYVDANRDKLVSKSALEAQSSARMNLQTGVKTESGIILVESDVVLQDGSVCGFSPEGETRVSLRKIKAPVVKVNQTFCQKELLSKVTQHEVRIAAGSENLPFEQDFIESVMKSLRAKKEQLLWKGDTESTDPTLKLGDGLLKILKADVPNQITGAALTSANIIEEVDKVFMAIPAEVLDKSEIWLGVDAYRMYVKALQDKNLYHVEVSNVQALECNYPGSTIKVVGIPGLNGTSTIIGGDPKNFYFGTDMEGDSEVFDFFYSKDDRVFKLVIEFTQGANVAFPDELALRTLTV